MMHITVDQGTGDQCDPKTEMGIVIIE